MTPNFPFLEEKIKIILKKFELYLLPLQQQDDLVFELSLSPFDQHALWSPRPKHNHEFLTFTLDNNSGNQSDPQCIRSLFAHVSQDI